MRGAMHMRSGHSKTPLSCLPVDFFQAGEVSARPEAVSDIRDYPLYPGLIFWLSASGRVDNNAVVMCQLIVTLVKFRVIEIWLDYPGLQIIRDNSLRSTAEKL